MGKMLPFKGIIKSKNMFYLLSGTTPFGELILNPSRETEPNYNSA